MQIVYGAVMLMAGIGIPVLAALNSRLGAAFGSPPYAVLVLIAVALLSLLPFLAFQQRPESFFQAPLYSYFGGVFFLFYILSITWIAPHFGLGNAIFFVLLGQILCSAVVDHFGLLGVKPVPVDKVRLMGLALMAAGVFFSVRR